MKGGGRRKGFTLIEVVVAMLITAIMVSSVFTVSLHTRRNDVRNDRRVIAEQATRQLTSSLQSYVTGDHSVATSIAGIAAFQAPNGSWNWNGGVSETNTCSTNTNYALCMGSHTLTGFLPGWFEASPFNARAVYYVTFTAVTKTISGPPYYAWTSSNTWVSAAVTWAEP